MKIINCSKACLRKFHRGALAATLLGLACIAAVNAQASSASPVGAWDCKINGANRGVGALYFFEDGTVLGYETVIPTAQEPTSSDRGSTDEGRSNTNAVSNTASNLFGSTQLTGTWSFDNHGRVIGLMSETGVQESCFVQTNVITITVTNVVGGTNIVITSSSNDVQTICTTNFTTNGFSFVAKSRPNHLTLQATGDRGHVLFGGILLQHLQDISGSYYALGRKQDSPNFTEFLTLSASDLPNVYDVLAQTPTATLTGTAIVSAQKRLALQLMTQTNSIESVSVGSFNFRNSQSTLSTRFGDKKSGNLRLFPN